MHGTKAFTMIELIFAIVIIGVLASVALPRLLATRDDAVSSRLSANAKICIDNAIASYKGRGIEPNLSEIPACVKAIELGASFSFAGNDLVVSNVSDRLNGSYPYKGTRVVID